MMPNKIMTDKSKTTTGITGLILAGGRARRMNGQDKGLLQLAGVSLIERCVASLSPQVNRLLISANRNIADYEQLGFPVLQDSVGDYQGPLAGLQRALEMSPEMPVQVVPCDAPLFSKHLVDRLFKAHQDNGGITAVPHDGTRLQPLFALFPPAALISLNEYLATGQRKVESWVISLPHTVVDFSDKADSFLNINTEEDLLRAESCLEMHK
jgi:molybdenum cofactor guanylyltransferase